MPELPEVETIVHKLAQVLPGKTLLKIDKLHSKSLLGEPTLLQNQVVTKVTRRAKIIQIIFENDLSLLVHLKMTGQLIYVDPKGRLGGGHPTQDWVAALPSKHTRVALTFDQDAQLFFNDQRLFGWVKIVTPEEVVAAYSRLAPDIIDPAVTPAYFADRVKNRSQAIKVSLMDTTIVGGVGNIYACDALNLAQIHPKRPAKSLTSSEIERLVTATKQVIESGIKLGGTTFDGMYVDIDGLAGSYQSVVRVYGREGKPCLNCQGEITKFRLGGRGTYVCEKCQVLSLADDEKLRLL